MTNSPVYFIRIGDSDDNEARAVKLSVILDSSGLLSRVKRGSSVAIKMHFGERGNTAYIKPDLIVPLVNRLIARGARPMLTDTNALYSGSRTRTQDHIQTAHEHGFTKELTGSDVVIAEGDDGKDVRDVAINGNYVKAARVASLFCRADSIVGIAHFKAHLLTGFGGALKNIGMGCASREGKLSQHSDVSPHVGRESCSGCSTCEDSCPVDAISMVDGKARIEDEKCIGCAECIAVCPDGAITVDWESGASFIQERMAEYAKAALLNKEDKSVFINFAVNIRQECDCFPQDFPVIAPDVGIFASVDPVALDKASMDMVIKISGVDVFKRAHPNRDGLRQLRHAANIGVGNMDYELVEVE